MMKKAILIFGVIMLVLVSIGYSESTDPCADKDLALIKQHIKLPKNTRIVKKIPAQGGHCTVIIDSDRGYHELLVSDQYVVIGTMVKHGKAPGVEAISNFELADRKKNIGKLAEAASIVREKAGASVLYMFTDPLCPFCNKALKKLPEIADKKNLTLKLILFSVHGEKGRDKVREAICKNFTFEQYSKDGWKKKPVDSDLKCERAEMLLAKAENVARLFKVRGVPMFVYEDGRTFNSGELWGIKK